ncbi:MAG TPA: FAD-binding oxidoreductase [Gemmatimonadaceae bacterium]
MREHPTEIASWNRRDFVRAGLVAAGVATLGACARPGTWTAAAAADPASDLDNLTRGVRGRLLRGSSTGYDEARKVWNLAYDRRPLAMVRAANVDDVRRCVEFARTHTVPIAIRGGGHSYAGYGAADGALQIDLGEFTTVNVDRDRRTASVGGGTRIRDLLAATLAAGLYTPMGACGSVGVAGLTLAGGDTSGRGLYGTACDNLIGAQLVTADGDVLELGPGKNENLYWAVRGGGGNFGVVTRLDFRLHPVVPMHTAAFAFGWRDVNDLAGALRKFGDLVRETPDEVRAGFYVDPVSGASASCDFRGDAAAAAAYLEKWKKAFRPTEARLSTSTPSPDGETWNTTRLAVEGAFIEDLSGSVVDVLARAAVEGRGVGQLLLGLSNGVAARIPMSATAYPLRGTGLSSLVAAEWDTPEARARAEKWVAETGAALRPFARRAYVNYLPPSTPERIREVYGANYPRLARIKAQYDPANLFRSNQNILPGTRS